jgi:ankyrin repeat protein
VHHELPARLDPEHYRKEAKRLLRQFQAGDAEAVVRAEDVLGERARTRFQLTDAQYVLAVEHGHRSWAEFRRALEQAEPEGPVGRIGPGFISQYEERAEELVRDLASGAEDAFRRIRAHVPRLAGASDEELVELPPRDARLVVAREYGFPTWRDLVHYVEKARAEAAQPLPPERLAGRAAVAADDVDALRALLDRHAGLADALLEDLTQPDVFDRQVGTCAELLVERAGNRDVCLNLAACFDRVELVELLLAAGAADTSTEIWGVTPLETALYHVAIRAAELLAARRIVPYALWTVAALGRVDLIAELVGPGLRLRPSAAAHRPNLANVGWPPGPPPRDDPEDVLGEALTHAAHNGRDESVAWLLDRGVDVDSRPYLGLTALHFAVQGGWDSTIRLLVDRGARLDLRDGIHGATPVGWAEHLGLEHLRGLLEAAAAAPRPLAAVRAQLEALREGEVVVESGLEYIAGTPVRVRVVRRPPRTFLDDLGAAVELAGWPRGWHDVAGRVVESFSLNLNRSGVVSVPIVGDRDPTPLVRRIAACSLAVYEELLELER